MRHNFPLPSKSLYILVAKNVRELLQIEHIRNVLFQFIDEFKERENETNIVWNDWTFFCCCCKRKQRIAFTVFDSFVRWEWWKKRKKIDEPNKSTLNRSTGNNWRNKFIVYLAILILVVKNIVVFLQRTLIQSLKYFCLMIRIAVKERKNERMKKKENYI